MAENNGSSNTAIIAILVLVLIAVVAFFVFNGMGGNVQPDEPDVNIEVTPDAGGGGE